MKFFVLASLLFFAAVDQSTANVDWSNLISLEPNVPSYPLVKGKPAGGSRITGGIQAKPHQFPYQAGLLITTESGTAFCGGSLISNEWILTAAHCAEPGSSFEVVLGAHKIKEDEPSQVRITTTEKHIHPQWSSSNLQNDIALLKLPSKVELNENIQLIRLPSHSQAHETFQGHITVVSGWGKDSDNANGISEVLNYVDSPVISNSQCNSYYFGMINNAHICTSGSGGKSTCSGDSGGPLVIDDTDGQGTQIGIVSFGISFGCEIGWPPAFARVTTFLSWIESTTGIQVGN